MCRLRGLLQSSPGDKTLVCTRPAAEGLGEVDGFEMDSAEGPDVGSKAKRRFKCSSSPAQWGLAPFTETGITRRWWQQGWGGKEFSHLPARGPAASAEPCPSRGGQAAPPAVGCLQRRNILPRATLDNSEPSVRSCFSGNTWNTSAVF